MCKTWEGELQLAAMPGTMPEMFDFSTRSDSIAAELNRYNGQHVVLTYEQHKGVPSKCFGDTEYFVTGVKPVGSREGHAPALTPARWRVVVRSPSATRTSLRQEQNV